MELRDYIRILRKSWMLILAFLLAGTATAAVCSMIMPPRYETTTQLYVSVQGGESSGSANDLVLGTSFARQAVTSYVDVVDTAIVLDRVIEELDLGISAEALATRVSADSPLNTVLINVTVADSDGKRATQIANAIGEVFSQVVVNELENPEGDSPNLIRIETVQPAVVPSEPVSPNVKLNLALGAFIGLLVGLGIAVLRYILDTRIHSQADIEAVTDAALLGGIAFDSDAQKRPLVVHADPRNPRAESFRSLRTSLQFINVTGGPRSYVVTSSIPGEGKSTTTANLAVSLAETGAKVALIEGDLRLPKLAEYMGVEGSVGLTDVLIGKAELADVLQKWGRDNLFVLASGQLPPNPSEMLGSQAMERVLVALTEAFDYVLIDAPPLLLVTDAAVVSKLTAGAIMIAAAGRTKKHELTSSIRILEGIGSKLVGVVVTMLPTKGPDSYAYGQYSYGNATSHAPVERLTRARRNRRSKS